MESDPHPLRISCLKNEGGEGARLIEMKIQ